MGNNLIKKIFLFLMISILMSIVYTESIQIPNAYAGMNPLDTNVPNLMLSALWLLICVFNYPWNIRRPSDNFYVFYVVFVLLPGVSLWGVSENIDTLGAFVLLLILSLPLVFMRIFIKIFDLNLLEKIRLINVSVFLSYRALLMIPLFLVIFIAVFSNQEGSFDIDNSYVRRLSGRDTFAGGSIEAYLLQMTMNGIAPFLAFAGAYSRKYLYALIAILFSIYCYWLLGNKAPILMVAILFLTGLFYRRKQANNLPVFLLIFILMLLIFILVENYLFAYSYVADYFIRRVFGVVTQIQGIYIGYAIENFKLENWLFGMSGDVKTPISYFLGDLYFSDMHTNLNSNTFLYSLLEKGLFGYFVAIFIISIVFFIMDYLYSRKRCTEALGISLLFSILLAEQAYSTVLVSSGVGIVVFILLFTRLKS